jgi:hypothetical protein
MSSTNDTQWVETNIVEKTDSWEEAKKVFLKHFDTPLKRAQRLQELWTSVYKLGQDMRVYCDKYLNTMAECGVEDNNEALAVAFIMGLPQVTQEYIYMAKFAGDGELSWDRMCVAEAMTLAISFAHIHKVEPTAKKASHTASDATPKPSNAKKSPSTSDTSNTPGTVRPAAPPQYCPWHKREVAHKPEDCRLNPLFNPMNKTTSSGPVQASASVARAVPPANGNGTTTPSPNRYNRRMNKQDNPGPCAPDVDDDQQEDTTDQVDENALVQQMFRRTKFVYESPQQ